MTLPLFDISFFALIAAVLVAGVARGLSGFGTGMIVAPIAGALYGPKTALVVIVVMDSIPSLPVAIPALRQAHWREVTPVFAGLTVCFPLGVFILTNSDAEALRWVISVTILACVAVLWSGWRYHGPRNSGISFAAGGFAGVLSGIAAIPGPPVIIYWMASGLKAATVRANMMSLFFLGEFVSMANLWIAGLFTYEAVALGAFSAPFYLAGLLLGSRLFRGTSEANFRLATFALIVCAAVLTLPSLDRVFGSIAALFG